MERDGAELLKVWDQLRREGRRLDRRLPSLPGPRRWDDRARLRSLVDSVQRLGAMRRPRTGNAVEQLGPNDVRISGSPSARSGPLPPRPKER